MKKIYKIITVLFISFIFTVCSNVQALTPVGGTAVLSTISGSYSKIFNSYLTFGPVNGRNGVLTGKKSQFFDKYTLDNNVVLCMSIGRHARIGDIYLNTGVSVDSLPNATYLRRAYGYYSSHPDDERGFIISAILTWYSMNGTVAFTGTPDDPAWIEFLGYVIQAYQKFGYDTSVQTMNEINSKINQVVLGSPYVGTLTIWKNLSRSDGQDLLGPGPIDRSEYSCETNNPSYSGPLNSEVMTSCVNYSIETLGWSKQYAIKTCQAAYCTAEIKPTCPNGQMVKNGGIGACSDNNVGSSYTFNYSATVGKNENVHYQYGELQNVSGLGGYCKLYCTETATANLPGGFANALAAGTNIVWPTSSNTMNTTFGNIYPLSFSGTKTCHLAINDPNAPGNNCTLTPEKDYATLYNQLNSKHNLKDTHGTTRENVRYSIEVLKAFSACGSGMNKGNTGNYEYYVVTGSDTGYYNKTKTYSDYAKATEVAAQNAQSAKTAYEKAQSYANNYSPKTETVTYDVPYTCEINVVDKKTGLTTKQTSTCTKQESREQETAGYKKAKADAAAKKSAWDSAVSAYHTTMVNITEYYNNNVNYCNEYSVLFSQTRAIANEISKCYNYEPSGCNGGSCSIYHFNAGASLNYSDSEYSVNTNTNQVNPVNYSCSGCSVSNKMKNASNIIRFSDLSNTSQMHNQISQIKSRVIRVSTNSVYFEMESPYRYINRRTGKASTSSNNGENINVGYSFLPISYNDSLGIRYNIGLSNIYLGENSRFSGNNDYVCHFTVNSNSDECLCPMGTDYAGRDLFSVLAGSNGLSCSDAQANYCNKGGTSIEDYPNIDPSDKYCPNDSTKKITACLNSGYSKSYCEQLICYGGSPLSSHYQCKNSNNVGGHMDITSCVYTKVAQGLTVNEAIDECDSLVCPISGGIKIIYRTISLENPFPGKNISNIVDGFNSDVKGRYPGTNWNSISLVQKEILNNRHISGSQVYNKEPLYVFELTPDVIKNIRDYNDDRVSSGGYADFTLTCNSNGTACVSRNFVHKNNYGLVRGTCSNVTSTNSSIFYACSEE